MITAAYDHSVYECHNINAFWSKKQQCSSVSRENCISQIMKRRPFTTETLGTTFPRFSWTSVMGRSSQNSHVERDYERNCILLQRSCNHICRLVYLVSGLYWLDTGISSTVTTQYLPEWLDIECTHRDVHDTLVINVLATNIQKAKVWVVYS